MSCCRPIRLPQQAATPPDEAALAQVRGGELGELPPEKTSWDSAEPRSLVAMRTVVTGMPDEVVCGV